MMKKRVYSLSALLVASFLLSSCYIYWNTGECLRDSTVTYTGVDTTHPVGNVLHLDKTGAQYMQAPEVTYKMKHNVTGITPNGLGPGTDPDAVHVTDITPTGRDLWVKVDEKNCYIRQVDAPPADAAETPYTYNFTPTLERLGSFHEERNAWSVPATAASIPLQYIVDPVLTVTTTALGYTVETCAFIIAAPFFGAEQIYTNCTRKKGENNQPPPCDTIAPAINP